jgi:hypothetical protein
MTKDFVVSTRIFNEGGGSIMAHEKKRRLTHIEASTSTMDTCVPRKKREGGTTTMYFPTSNSKVNGLVNDAVAVKTGGS